jgi:16S rRNA (guanine527-N7)-methyltransferase
VRQAIDELGLANVRAVHGAIEKFPSDEKFATLVARAYGSLSDMAQQAGRLIAPGGQFLAMKGVVPEDELKHLPAPYAVRAVKRLHVPQLNAERHLIVVTP